ncbi:PAS domain S-box protein [Rhodospirillum sp. A1_3_36]|uniref:PAS domain S-box protein n=1 Tax=Rhodospirillum sp. A1_3_36 TaxID=3391666 RepID=UPI0039A6FF30
MTHHRNTPSEPGVPAVFATLVTDNEEWLVHRILFYARELGYSQYASAQMEAWRASICGLSGPLVAAIRRGDPIAYPTVDEAPEASPVAAFGVAEARLHRTRGVSLPLFLGLMKHYRRSYHGLVDECGGPRNNAPNGSGPLLSLEEALACHAYIDRFFDRVELAFCSEWTSQDHSHQLEELRDRNRRLTSEKNKFLTMVESSPLPVLFITADGVVDHRNGAARRSFGNPPKDRWPHPEDIALLTAPDHPRKTDQILPTVRGDRHFVVRTLAMADLSDQFSGTLIICDDVTLEKDVERRLRDSEHTLRSMTDAAMDGIIMIDGQGQIRFWNRAAQTIFGYEEKEVLGARVDDLLAAPDTKAQANGSLLVFLKDGKTPVPDRAMEMEARHKDGRRIPIELSVGPVDLEGHHHAVGVVRDITEKKEAQIRLTQAQKAEALGNLAGGIAHDFNNMLLPIIGLTELTREDLPEDHPGRTRLGFVLEAAHRAADLVKRILAFSRKDTPEKRPVLFGDVLARAEELLRSTLPSTIHLVTAYDCLGGQILADPAQLQAVIMNLASNARDAMAGRPGTLTLSLSEQSPPEGAPKGKGASATETARPWFRLRVVDTGHGMDAATLVRVFDPFFTTKDVGLGTGLGLSMVQGVVAAHGGVVRATSAPGEGATFDVYLPRLVDNPPSYEQAGKGAPI